MKLLLSIAYIILTSSSALASDSLFEIIPSALSESRALNSQPIGLAIQLNSNVSSEVSIGKQVDVTLPNGQTALGLVKRYIQVGQASVKFCT